MAKFISREKLSKKARKELDNQKRAVWAFSPTTRKVDSKKLYSRKKSAHAWKDDFGMGACCFGLNCLFCNKSLRIRRGHKGFVCRQDTMLVLLSTQIRKSFRMMWAGENRP